GCPDRQIRCFPGRQRTRSPPPWWPQAPRPVSCTFLDPEANLVEVESMVMLPRFLLPGAPRSNNSSLEARRWFLISSPPSPCRLGSKVSSVSPTPLPLLPPIVFYCTARCMF
uniref:Uncharacterized protein n=1 Tax=Aegilops tauschii subsp. strangulata TaxID=200361 RepID=A0A453F4Z4_AEGTS